ncbi:hypothetical protein GGR53DRAFT_148765 [Hypoxylon sp. FL1150]|nr:hypothetical protein GGR53DRAFT_148765 [Hypoxylon sp. FL1150]
MMDALSVGDDYNRTSESFVRRDVLADRSQAIPYGNIAELTRDSWWVRLPAEESGHDILTTMDGVKSLVEGPAWVLTPNQTRLPAPEAYRRAYLTLDQPEMRDVSEWSAEAETKITSLLWPYEKQSWRREG